MQDCERQLQQAHVAAQALAAEKGDLHSQLASLEQALVEKAALHEHIAELEAKVSCSLHHISTISCICKFSRGGWTLVMMSRKSIRVIDISILDRPRGCASYVLG